MAIEEGYFHIFYYICEKFNETKGQDYYYANQANVSELPRANSRYLNIELKRHWVLKLMTGILSLRNIDFTDSGNNANTNTNGNTNVLNRATIMLDVDPSYLASVLLTRENKIRGETFITPLSVEEARKSRDTFAKQIYSKKF